MVGACKLLTSQKHPLPPPASLAYSDTSREHLSVGTHLRWNRLGRTFFSGQHSALLRQFIFGVTLAAWGVSVRVRVCVCRGMSMCTVFDSYDLPHRGGVGV